MSITIKSTHRLRIGDMAHDLTTEELIELRDQIDLALATRRNAYLEDWRRYSKELQPLKDWTLPLVTCGDSSNKLWMGPLGSGSIPRGPVESAQTHVQP